MSRIPAKRSLNTFAPRIASPLTIPGYFVMRRPSRLGVVTVSMMARSYGTRARVIRARRGISSRRARVPALDVARDLPRVRVEVPGVDPHPVEDRVRPVLGVRAVALP